MRDRVLRALANALLRWCTPGYRDLLDATYRLGLRNLDEMASWTCPHCGRTAARSDT